MSDIKQEDAGLIVPKVEVMDSNDKQTLVAVLQFLKKHNLAGTEELLKKEAGFTEEEFKTEKSNSDEADVANALVAYKSDRDPSIYEESYQSLLNFIDGSLDVHKCELSCLMFPVFVHMYLELVYNNHEDQAKSFFERFHRCQEEYHKTDLTQLAIVTKAEHMISNQLIMENYRGSKFTIRILRDSYNRLKRCMVDRKLTSLSAIIDEHLYIDVFDGSVRTKQQIDMTSGSMVGDVRKEANKTKIFYGLLKEPEINIPLDDEMEEAAPGDESKPSRKRKIKRDPALAKKTKNDPNAPPTNRIPLPELKDSDKLERKRALRELSKKVLLGPDTLPSICFYTFLNSLNGVTNVEICEDSSLMSAGMADSMIRIWSLNNTKLRSIRSPNELELLDKDADDIMERIMDERTASDSKQLKGHSGPVYATSFSPDRNFLLSSSQDGTARLWSLQTWSNLVCYRGHLSPVWDAKIGPYGHYFATAGWDRTARLWTFDHHAPIRVFAGHMADVDCVEFHPNSNYIATGSSDRTVRIWDILNGQCVRTMAGHKDSIQNLKFSPDGRYLASAGVDKQIMLWDISSGEPMAQMQGHTETIYSLAFSREGSVLASGGIDNTVKLWNVNKVISEEDQGTVAELIDGKSLEIGSFRTKSTPVLALHFTRRKTQSSLGRWIIRPQLIDALRAYICDVHIYSTEDSQRVLYCINEQFQALLQIMFIFFY